MGYLEMFGMKKKKEHTRTWEAINKEKKLLADRIKRKQAEAEIMAMKKKAKGPGIRQKIGKVADAYDKAGDMFYGKKKGKKKMEYY